MISDLKKAAQGYPAWKNQQSNFRKPWRYPDQITAQRVSVFDVSILLSPLDKNLTSFETLTALFSNDTSASRKCSNEWQFKQSRAQRKRTQTR